MKRNRDLMAWQFFEEETPVKVVVLEMYTGA